MKEQIELTDWQKDIIIGSVYGGSSLVKPMKGINYYLSMRSKNSLWLSYKMQELDSCFRSCHLNKDKQTFRCNSLCLSTLTDIHDILYNQEEERIVTEQALYPLRDIGLAIWFLEAGGWGGRGKKNIYLNTTKIREEGTDKIVQYFNDLGIDCTKSASKARIRVIFTITGSERFFEIIGHRIPEFMLTTT